MKIVSTGTAWLDAVLGGGIPRGSVVALAVPGSPEEHLGALTTAAAASGSEVGFALASGDEEDSLWFGEAEAALAGDAARVFVVPDPGDGRWQSDLGCLATVAAVVIRVAGGEARTLKCRYAPPGATAAVR